LLNDVVLTAIARLFDPDCQPQFSQVRLGWQMATVTTTSGLMLEILHSAPPANGVELDVRNLAKADATVALHVSDLAKAASESQARSEWQRTFPSASQVQLWLTNDLTCQRAQQLQVFKAALHDPTRLTMDASPADRASTALQAAVLRLNPDGNSADGLLALAGVLSAGFQQSRVQTASKPAKRKGGWTLALGTLAAMLKRYWWAAVPSAGLFAWLLWSRGAGVFAMAPARAGNTTGKIIA
jgi:hypothetical protein